MKYRAYWMHIKGETIPVGTIHIAEVIKNPEKFNYTRNRIEALYREFNEPIGHEGNARHKIMADIIKNHGWIRLRFKPHKDLWTVELNKLTDEIKEMIVGFLRQPSVSGNHIFATITITELFTTTGERHNTVA